MPAVTIATAAACRVRVWTGLQRLAERRTEGAAILVYHGVVPRLRDPVLDAYAIDAAAFRAHLRFFRRTREVVPLKAIVEHVRRGEAVPGHWTAITLDDALQNQVTLAAEILGEAGCPWALAVPAGLIGTGRSIWTYEARFLLLACWPFRTLRWPGDDGAELPTGSRDEKRATLSRLLRFLFEDVSDERRQAVLEELIDRAGRAEFVGRMTEDGRFPLATWAQLQRLRESGVELLSHGWRHRPQNGTLSPEALVEEVVASRRRMAECLGEAPAGFALPHGVKSEALDALLEDAGYTFCLSSEPRRVGAGAHAMSLPRYDAEYSLPVLRRHLVRRS